MAQCLHKNETVYGLLNSSQCLLYVVLNTYLNYPCLKGYLTHLCLMKGIYMLASIVTIGIETTMK